LRSYFYYWIRSRRWKEWKYKVAINHPRNRIQEPLSMHWVRSSVDVRILGRRTGVVLHQPLSLAFFWKNTKKAQNMNGIPVCLAWKTENAPTWRPQNPKFQALFLAYFSMFWCQVRRLCGRWIITTHQPTQLRRPGLCSLQIKPTPFILHPLTT